MMPRTPASTFAAIAALAAGAVAVALVLQHGFGMEPCAWCIFQRILFLALAATALLAATLHGLRPAFALMGGLSAVLSAGGLWAALHQHFVAARTDSCVYTFADRFLLRTGLDEAVPALFEATASCADANLPLLGLPFAFWSAALFGLLCIASIGALRARFRKSQ